MGRVTADTIHASVTVASVKGTVQRDRALYHHPADRQEHVLKVLRSMQEGEIVVFASSVIVTRTGESWEIAIPG